MSSADSIKVVCRFRPQNKREDNEGGTNCIDFESDTVVNIRTPDKPTGRKFNFDRIFPPECSQAQVYDFAAKPLLTEFFKGFNGTIFVYGQTGSGKSHTMTGPSYNDKELRGIIPRVIDGIFDTIDDTDEHITFTLSCSYVEIYMEKIRDLLCPKNDNLQVRESKEKGIYIEDVSSVFVDSPQRTLQVMQVGTDNRIVAATQMNAVSSRSHSLFFFNLTQEDSRNGSKKSGKLYLVDLAGSEKIAKTGVEGQRLDEAKAINASLSALGNVINALTDSKAKHVPYRDSKLTRILQESLGGNAKTTLIICCSCSSFNDQETLSTMRFGDRAKSIKNKAQINQELSVAELKKLLDAANREIARLKRLNGIGEVAAPQERDQKKENDGVDHSEQIAELKKIIEKQEEDIQRLNSQIEDTAKQMEDIQRESDDANSKYLTAQAEFETYKENTAGLEDELVKAREMISLANEEKMRATAKVAITEDTIELLNSRIKSLEEENKLLSVEMSENLIKNGPAGIADCGEIGVTGGTKAVVVKDNTSGNSIDEGTSDSSNSSIDEDNDSSKKGASSSSTEKKKKSSSKKKSSKEVLSSDVIEKKFSGEADMDLLDSIFNAEERSKENKSLSTKILDYLMSLSATQLSSFYNETFNIIGEDKIGKPLSDLSNNTMNSESIGPLKTPSFNGSVSQTSTPTLNRRMTTGSAQIFVNPNSVADVWQDRTQYVDVQITPNLGDSISDNSEPVTPLSTSSVGNKPLEWESNKELFGLLKIIALEGVCQGKLLSANKAEGIDLDLVREQFEMLNKFISTGATTLIPSTGSSSPFSSSIHSTTSGQSTPTLASNLMNGVGYGLANTSFSSARRRATIGNTTMLANMSAIAAQNGFNGINTTMNTSLLQSQMVNCTQFSGARDLSMMLNENGITASQKNAIKREYQKTISQYRKQNKLLTAQVELLKQRFILLTKQRVESELAASRQIEELAAKCGQSDKLLVTSEAKRLSVLEKYRNIVCLAVDGEKQSRLRQLSEVAIEYKRDIEALQNEKTYDMRRIKALTINLCNAKSALDDARAETALLRQRISQLTSQLTQQQNEILTTATIKDEYISQYLNRCEVQQRIIHKLSQKTLSGGRARFLTFSGIDFDSLNNNESLGFTTNTLIDPISVSNGANVGKFKRVLRGGKKNTNPQLDVLADSNKPKIVRRIPRSVPNSNSTDNNNNSLSDNKRNNNSNDGSATLNSEQETPRKNNNDNNDNNENKIPLSTNEDDANVIASKNNNTKDVSELTLNLARYVKKNAELITQLNAILMDGETTEDTAMFFLNMFSGKKENVNLYDANGLEMVNDKEVDNNLEKIMGDKDIVNSLLLPYNSYIPAPMTSLLSEQIYNNSNNGNTNSESKGSSINSTNISLKNNKPPFTENSRSLSINGSNAINANALDAPSLDNVLTQPRLPRPSIKTLKLHREKLSANKQNDLISALSNTTNSGAENTNISDISIGIKL